MQESNYHTLVGKLDEFIRKYYKNQLIRGAIYSTALVLVFYLSLALAEYFGHFSSGIRTFLFYAFILSNGYILARLVAIPLLKLNRLGTTISHEQAAAIIGCHFTQVQDKLTNLLQLQADSSQQSATSSQLLEASINQRIRELKPVPFSAAIDLSENRKYLKYALLPLLAFCFILFSAPSIITDSTERLVKHGTYFEKQAPFKFVIGNKDLRTVQQEDFELMVKLTGDEVPQDIYIEIDGNEYKLSKENTVSFSYVFKNVQQSVKFRLAGDGYTSQEYELLALPNPVLLDFDVALSYPKYLNKKDEVIRNTGDLVIPAGTKVSWQFNTRNTNKVRISFDDTSFALAARGENTYAYTGRFLRDKSYSVTTSNEFMKSRDSVVYAINVIPDAYPTIVVEEQRDSVTGKQFFFRGGVKDDYGFTRLSFNYRFLDKKDSTGKRDPLTDKPGVTNIPVTRSAVQDQFMHAWDLHTLGIGPGDQIEYYFEVFDNDGVNGAKPARSQRMVFKAPTLQELEEQRDKNNSQLKKDLEESISAAKDLQKDINSLNKKIMEKKDMGWEEKKKLQDLLDKQKELQKDVEQIKKENSQNNMQQSEYQQADEKIVEKQRELEELFKNIMTDDIKKLFQELEKLMSQLDKEKIQEQLEKMKLTNKDIEKELDRTLELFKQMEVEQKMDEAIKKLDDLAKKQEELAEKTEQKNPDNKKLDAEQKDLQKQFEDLQKDLKDLEKKNSELERPNMMPKTDQQQEQVQKDMNQSSQQLQENKNKKASQSQKNASQQMKAMSDQMKQAQAQAESQNNSEDMNALRDILENLIQLSFDQEALMNEVSKTAPNNPKYTKLSQQQKKLQDDSKMIEDSLLALSKRQPGVKSIINKEINAINMNMGKAVDEMTESLTPSFDFKDHKALAQSRQQFAMTSINNLALLLGEALSQMQSQMQKSGNCAGGGSCKKPGNGNKPTSAADLRKMQEQLNKQIQQMKEAMEKGGQKPGQKPGQKGGSGMMGMSEELARMAAQQEAIRREMQKAMEQMGKDGKKQGGNEAGGNLANKMEQTETDLVNKAITQETIKRQQEILSRLLESEKAEKEREMDEKRQSNEAKNENYSNPNAFFEYNRLKMKEAELLKTVPPSLIPYYKNKVNEYFNNFQN